jgi:hypothetical protein
MVTAMIVRHAMEGFHAEHLTDEQMDGRAEAARRRSVG